ncbi:hypothetical protein MKW92_029174 [Papaver armeniacum]|nr:hypothetical protein MKW92_029174 [Papaver armeniacum]
MDPQNQLLDENWEWNSLLDFNVDDSLNISWSNEFNQINPSPPPEESNSHHNNQTGHGSDESDNNRVRKRDPRLTCENFLAGIIPCSCPEVDEKLLLEEEEKQAMKKRSRTSTASSTICCQVPGCEVDISELKGYHRRHRVCLTCANASSVFIDGETKRYCQQCGKFHILPDFDEGKEACRWKGKSGGVIADDLAGEGEAGKDSIPVSSHTVEEAAPESEDGRVSPLSSIPSSQSQDIRSAASGETQKEPRKDNSTLTLSSSFGDDKSAYSSVCPTGRISFKLYDWNPAEFPRRLRHQIFQWLASMPVELEGYIRPGCTILTIFIAMPRYMWEKVAEDAGSYIHKLVGAPDCLLHGRGTITVYLNDMIFRVLKGGTSLKNVMVEMQAPRLHYVHPTCFEAGKPAEFVVCGSNLLQPKFRFLISFGGKYLPCTYCFAISHGKTASCHGNEVKKPCCDHQIYKIRIPKTDVEVFGPAFIEVENEFGLSNFIPILFGDKQTCSGMKMVQKKLDETLPIQGGSQFGVLDVVSGSCKVFGSRQKVVSELILDIAWLLKEPNLEEDKLLSSWKNDSIDLLEKILQSLEDVMGAQKLFNPVSISDADLSLFQKHITQARESIRKRIQSGGEAVQCDQSSLSEGYRFSQNRSENGRLYFTPSNIVDMEMAMEKNLGSVRNSETIPLLNGDITRDNTHYQPRTEKSCGRIFSKAVMSPRPLVLIVAVAALCSGVCAVLFHPNTVGELAVSLRRSLFGHSKS